MAQSLSPRREVLVFGTGAVGAVLAWRIAQNPRVRVSVVCRSNYEAIRTQGITLRTALWGSSHFRPARVCKSPWELSRVPFDFVVCANKVTDSTDYREMSSVITDRTVLVSAQNGVGVEEPLQRSFPRNTVFSGVVNIACKQPRAGTFEQTSSINTHSLRLGLYSTSDRPTPAGAENSLREFSSWDPSFGIAPSVLKEKWVKQIWNGAFNPLAAISGLDTHQLLATPSYLAFAMSVMEEIRQIAESSGIRLESDIVEQLLAKTLSNATVVPSMLQDARAKKAMEVDSICGDMCRLADRFGVLVPKLKAVHQSLLELEQRNTARHTPSSPTRDISLPDASDIGSLFLSPVGRPALSLA